MLPNTNDSTDQHHSHPAPIVRSAFGGILMGLANLVPGISGGTMLLVAGVYPNFIQALADVTRLRLNRRSLLVLGTIGLAAGLAILLFAGTLKDLVLDHRWIMYSLFIGLTFGGLPLLLKMANPISRSVIVSALFAFAFMAAIAYFQSNRQPGEVDQGTAAGSYLGNSVAGVIAASAMILPGISGAYLLMVMGKHIPILHSIDEFKSALTEQDLMGMLEQCHILIPVGIGVLLGIALTGNSLKWLLQRYPKIVLGVLIGLLLGSVCGLYPFQDGIPPELGDVIDGKLVTDANIQQIEKKDWQTQSRVPTLMEALGAIALIGTGFFVTRLMAYVGGDETESA